MAYDERPQEAPRPVRFGRELLRDVVEAARARTGAEAWRSQAGRKWHHLVPPQGQDRVQGWKLHVSATPLSAPLVLAQTAPVLLRHGCAFKFAATLDQVVELTDGRCERGRGGKFLTAYPDDDEQFRALAEALDRATSGLPGPPVLSDRPYRPGSVVSYRFGAFRGVEVLTDDGSSEVRLRAPDGTTEHDRRQAWFSPPPWADPPFAETGRPEDDAPGGGARRAAGSGTRIGGRFTVRRALRHAYRGGVFVALDAETGTEVVLKQARPHVGSWFTGQDLRDALRHEARVLALLPGVAPRPIGLFEHEAGLFLAEEFIPGQTLGSWVTRRRRADGSLGAPVPEVNGMVGGLVDLLAAVHAQGLVCRDFNPNNVMVTPEGSLRLIDLEHAVVPGAPAQGIMTPGYAAPEQHRGRSPRPAPTPAADLYSLGAVLFYLLTGTHPLLLPDEPADRTPGGRLGQLLGEAGYEEPAAERFTTLFAALTARSPHERWSLGQVRDLLATSAEAGTEHVAPAPIRPAALPAGAARRRLLGRALEDGLAHLSHTATPRADRLWPATGTSEATDPCNAGHGAAGVLGVLVRAAALPGGTVTTDTVRSTADWIRERLPLLGRTLPGLFSGRAGTAWALLSAAHLLGDEAMERRAVDLALSLPVVWPRPGVWHGTAGAGLALVHMWRATGDPRIATQAHACADAALTAAGHTGPDGPDGPGPDLLGTAGYGFAHGVAGVGAFLLAMAGALGRADCLEGAARAGRTLVDAMEEAGTAGHRPTWPDAGDPTRTPRSWCEGTAGTGAFLIRLWQVTGDASALRCARRAGALAWRDRLNPSGSVCHGAPGSGELLLDLAQATGEQRYLDQAEALAACLLSRHGLRGARMLPADETGLDVSPGYATGLAGTLGFLARIRDEGPRLWMPDPARLPSVSGSPHGTKRALRRVGDGRLPGVQVDETWQ
ncbi:class IV lanthionine synthetase LanL [Streptomyces sp. NPDC006739]|uniref:class IV lanthionine synthetase LanL n=1 Tax=Streptomyces sp. NPDC006739 TaxID=3364763 RepID=UPI00368F2971